MQICIYISKFACANWQQRAFTNYVHTWLYLAPFEKIPIFLFINPGQRPRPVGAASAINCRHKILSRWYSVRHRIKTQNREFLLEFLQWSYWWLWRSNKQCNPKACSQASRKSTVTADLHRITAYLAFSKWSVLIDFFFLPLMAKCFPYY